MDLTFTARGEDTRDALASGQISRSLGKYRLFARLGAGGMADVYLAVERGAMNVNRLVVVKRLRDEHASDAATREMFLNEARLAARLSHSNVIHTLHASEEDGSYIITMEYVDGQTLARTLAKLQRDGRTLHPRLAARIMADALAGLHYAHELKDFDGSAIGIVHRDISPQNLMVTYEGTVKVLDFGIAKAAGGAQTAHGVFKGKVAFMAPEQVIGDSVDRRADIFASGIVLWEAISGQPLLGGDSPVKTLHNLLNKELPRLSTLMPIPEALDDIVAKALERNVEDRFQTAKEMREALEAFLADGTPVTHEEVGELTQTLFADTRTKIQGEIGAQLASLSLGRTSAPNLSTEAAGPPSSGRIPALGDLTALNTGDTSPSGSIVKVESTHNHVAEKPSRAKRIGFAAWIGLTLLTLGLSTFAIVRSRPGSSSTAAPPSAPSVAVAVPVAETVSAVVPSAVVPSAVVPPLVESVAAAAPPSEVPAPSAKPDAGTPKKKPKTKPKPKPAASEPATEEKTEPPKLLTEP